MSTGLEKLRWDLDVLAAMAAEMDDYLKSDVLYWPMARGDMPKLTLAGYLMRQRRLLQLADLLDDEEWGRLEAAIAQFNAALAEKIVRTEKRANEELGVRTRQWETYLKELPRDGGGVNYSSAAENRAMIAALTDFLENPPYQPDAAVMRSLNVQDNNLRRRWQKGEFVWPSDWEQAYPKGEYWWLYGRPK
jgi:hypothetical protein